MYTHIRFPSVLRPAALSALAVTLVVSLAATPALAASGHPAGGGSPLVPGAALTNAVLSIEPAQQHQPEKHEQQERPALQAPDQQQQRTELPDLRAAASRDSEVIRNLVYTADPQQNATGRQVYELSLLEAVELALRNNLQVQVNRYNPQNAFEGIRGARGQFDPQLSFTIPQQYQRGTNPTFVQTAGADVITSQSLSGGFSWREQLQWGTNYSLNWNANRRSDNNEFSTFNPSFTSGFSGNLTQPLLDGFGDVNRTNLLIAMNSYDQSLEGFRAQVENVIFQVVNAYWNFKAQTEGLAVREEALRLAQQQFERNEIQVQIGTLAPIETVQAETQVAQNELQLIAARNSVETAEDNLKQLINFDALVDDPFAWDLEATEDAEETVPPIDAEEAIRVALDNDPQLVQQRIGLRSTALRVDAAENALLPNLDLNASFNLSGRGGTRIIRGGFGGEETEVIETGFGTALSQVFSGDFNTWSLGATLTFPLHNHSARAQAAQARISQQQQMLTLEQLRQQLTYDVRQQVRNIENLVQQVRTAIRTRELSERQFEAERRKFEVGTTTNFQVLNFQQQLAANQLSEVQAIINLQNAIAQLEFTKGTLLQYFGVRIGDAGTGGGNDPAPLPSPISGRR